MEVQAQLQQEEEHNLKAEVEEERPDEELKDENDNGGEEQEAAPKPDKVDENGNNGGQDGKGDVPFFAQAAKTELDNENVVEAKGSTWTNIVHFDDERGK